MLRQEVEVWIADAEAQLATNKEEYERSVEILRSLSLSAMNLLRNVR